MNDKRRERRRSKRPPEAPPATKRRLRAIAVVALAAVGTWAFFEFVVWNKVPAALVDKWVVMSGDDKGAMIDFYRNGAMVTTVNKGADEARLEATVRVDGQKMVVTSRHQETGEVGTRVLTIRSLDETRLVLQDERGTSVRLERASNLP